jgi:hypothetical protein
MSRRVRNACWIAAAALSTFFAGVALASDGNYCEDLDTSDCIVVDIMEQDSCCMNLDGALRNWICTREVYWCFWSDAAQAGPGYNCHSPGGPCQ